MKRFVAGMLMLVVGLLSVPAAEAQDRSALLRQAVAAYDDFDPDRAIRLARAALDPALGPLDSTWVRGVHLLSQILLEENQESAAATWARWAMRMRPDLPIDSSAFLTRVVDVMRQARESAVRTAADEATRATYAWPTQAATATEARFRLAPSATPVSVLVRGVGLVGAGAGLVVPAGTYELEVNASGFLPLRLMREALPGVTTEFAFTLTPAAAAAATLAADVRSRVQRATVPLTVSRFGAPQACAAGLAAGGARLVVTSYLAIRGADAVAADGEVRVAAWDVGANLAVLVLPPSATPDSLDAAPALVEGQALWGMTLAECRVAGESRVLLDAWEGRPSGALILSESPASAAIGSPLVDYQGQFAGVWTGGARAAPPAVVAPLLERARENVMAQRLLTPQQVAQQENHRYGTLIVATDVPNATVRVTPVEAWHWETLATSTTAPLAFHGPAGRYRVQVSAPDVPARTQDVVIRAGETTRTAVSLRAVAQGPQPAARPERRGVSKWVWIGLIGGAGAAAALAGGGGGGGGGGSGGSTTGSVTITVPNP